MLGPIPHGSSYSITQLSRLQQHTAWVHAETVLSLSTERKGGMGWSRLLVWNAEITRVCQHCNILGMSWGPQCASFIFLACAADAQALATAESPGEGVCGGGGGGGGGRECAQKGKCPGRQHGPGCGAAGRLKVLQHYNDDCRKKMTGLRQHKQQPRPTWPSGRYA